MAGNIAANDLARFYEALSALVQEDQSLDSGQESHAMHRALRDPDRPDAPPSPLVLNRLIAERTPKGARVLDAGCGWGGTLFHLAKEREANGVGVTLSPRQQARAMRVAEKMGLAGTLKFLEGDYNQAEIAPAGFDRIIMVETLHHNRDPLATLARMRTLATAHARILVVDDFAAPGLAAEDARARAFKAGWRFGSFPKTADFLAALNKAGLRGRLVQDLTPLCAPRQDVETAALLRTADAEIAACGPDEEERRLALEALRGGYVLEQLYTAGDAVYAMIEIEI